MEIRGLQRLARNADPQENSVEAQILNAARGKGVTRHGDWDEVIRLLDHHHIHPDAIISSDHNKYSLLALAATEPAPEACERLIAMGANPRHGGAWSRTPLIEVVHLRNGTWGTRHRKVVKLLAATINAQDSDGRTALMFAATGAGAFSAKRGNLGLVKQLVELGADLSLRNRWDRTALMEAVKYNDASPTSANADVVALLISYTLEHEAQRIFQEHYKAEFSDNGELTVTPKSVPVVRSAPSASSGPSAPPKPAVTKGWTRTRAARQDATVQTIARKVETFFGLPEASVALVDTKRKPLSDAETIGTLWRKHGY